MVCKEDLCRWFKNLSPHKRIDYMCGMLQMCLPMELRFIGSYVEDLAKKDFHQLRESEGKANNRHELSKFSETDGRVFRTKMAVYLALMHSSNRTCSNIIYKLLEKHVREALTVIETMDVITVHNILLVLSMAMNHPAFTFHQKSRMYEYYREANEAAERILIKTLPEPELLILSESCDLRSCDQRLSPMCSPRVPQMHVLPSPVAPLSSQCIHSPATQDKVYVCEIDVKNSRQRDKEKNTLEYVIQIYEPLHKKTSIERDRDEPAHLRSLIRIHAVRFLAHLFKVTWSNGEKKNVFKTYQELVEFHKKLMKTFEKDIMSHQEAFKLPSLKGTQNHKKENRDLLSQYASSLSDLPEHIRQSNFFTLFFENTIHRPVKMTDACTSPRPPVLADVPVVQRLPNSGDEDTVIDQPYVGQPPSQNLYTSYLSQSPINGDMCNLSPHSPSHHELAYQAVAHSPCSAKTTSPLISSPCHSPVSSMESPANSVPGSPSVHDREDTSQQANGNEGTRLLISEGTSLLNSERQDGSRLGSSEAMVTSRNAEDFSVPNLLKFNNLAPYAELFIGYTLEQVASMRIEDIEMMGVPKHEVGAIKNVVLEKLREKQPPYLNGLIDPVPQAGLMWQPTYIHPVPGLGPMPPIQYHSAPPGAYQPVFNYPPFQDGVPMVPGAQDISPTNSEYSSPSPSPHLPQVPALRKSQQQHQNTDSSSEDGERDKKPGQYRGNGRVKGHSAPNSARSTRPERVIDPKQDTYSNNGTPPLPTEKCDSNVNNAGSNGSSGYTSDPTSTRPLMRTYKAQPAHTSTIQPHSKVVINMPENNFKGGTQPFVQMMAPPHMRDMAMNSTSGHPGYTMSPADIGHRSMIYFPQGHPMFARSHFNPVNVTGSRPIFHPAAAVNQSMIPAQPTVMNGNAPVATGNKAKGFHGSTTVVAPNPLPGNLTGKSPNILMNGVDNQPQTSDTSTHRCSATPAVVSSASSSSSTVTYTSSGQTVTTNRPASCSNCGCPGHREGTIPTNLFLPQMHTNMWPTPYPNGLVPMHMQMPHLYHHHMPYHPNGLNHELYNPTVYGMSHSNGQGVAGISNVIYNNYNNHQTSGGGYNQKKPKKLNCHNCGSSKHAAGECPEVSMEAMSGQPIYSYKPKNESD